MAKILIVTSGLNGIFNASTKLISILKEKGHTVTSASPNKNIVAENLSFPHIYLNPLIQEPIIKISFDVGLRGISGLIKKHLNRAARRKEAIEVIEPKDFLPMIHSLSPDLILIDIEVHEYIILAQSTKIPFLLLNQFFSVWNDGGLPSIQSKTILGEGWSGTRMGMKIDFFKLLIKRNYQAFKRSILSGGLSRIEILFQMAKKWNFPMEFIGLNLWPGPYLYNKIGALNMSLEALDFPHKKRPNMHYIGPMVNMERKDGIAITQNSYSLEDVLQKAENSRSKILYCSVGTMKIKDIKFLEKIVRAINDLPSWILILSIGKYIDEQRFSNRSKNVFTFSHVPQIEVLSHASIAIVHGGVHTINECLMLKVPMLVYSGKRADQDGNTARLIYHGLTYRTDKDIDSSDDIRAKIIALSEDEVIAEKMEEMYRLSQKQLKSNIMYEVIDKAMSQEIGT